MSAFYLEDKSKPAPHYSYTQTNRKKRDETISIPDSGNIRKFEGGAIRDDDSKKPDYTCLAWDVVEEMTFYKMAGNTKYGKDNYLKGIPQPEFLKSAMRHLVKLIMGKTDERHDLAVIWNIMAYIEVGNKSPK